MYLWRAVDQEGEILDLLIQPRRDKRAAVRLMRKLLKKQGCAPKLAVTDKLRSYAAAFRALGLTCEQRLDNEVAAGPVSQLTHPEHFRLAFYRRPDVARMAAPVGSRCNPTSTPGRAVRYLQPPPGHISAPPGTV